MSHVDSGLICTRQFGPYITTMPKIVLAQTAALSTALLNRQHKSLEERLADVALPSAEVAEIASLAAGKTIRDTVLGFVPFGEAIKTLISFSDDIAEDIKKLKKEKILEEALSLLEFHGDGLSKIASVLGNPYGSALLNKILQIADNSPPDADMLRHLAAALAHISDTEFAELFDEHKFALSLMERLSPQALNIATNYGGWPSITMQNVSITENRVTSDWQTAFAKAYAIQKGIIEPSKVERLLHSVRELYRNEILQCLPPSDLKGIQPSLTPVGRDLAEYLHYR